MLVHIAVHPSRRTWRRSLTTSLPNAVTELLANRIDSFEKLDLVLALHAQPRATMTVEALCRALKLPRDVIRQTAIELRGAALMELTMSGEVQLLPPTSNDHQAVTELIQLYNEDRVTVVRAIGEIAVARLRRMASRAFADEFVMRKNPRKDGDG